MPYRDPADKRASLRRLFARRRAEWFAGRVCARCGSSENLELDHIDPTTKDVYGRIWAWSRERREAELAKCQALCHDCHLAKTADERRPPHGTDSRYRSGCRCDDCRAAHTAAHRRWRLTKM